MPLHGGARLRYRALADRVQDLFVLLLEHVELDAFGGRCRASPHLAARNDEAAEIFQEALELRVAGGIGDFAMKREVLVDGVFAAADGIVDGGEAVGDFSDLRGEARSAASPAASTSTPVRNSMTLSTSRSVDRSSKSTRNGRRTWSATKAPTPCRVSTSRSAFRAATASRTTVRLTPVAAIISCSVGSCEPGGSLPLTISAVRRATSSPVSPRGGSSGRNNARFLAERLFKSLTPRYPAKSSYDMMNNTHGRVDQ